MLKVFSITGSRSQLRKKNSTIRVVFLHMSIASAFLNDKGREPHPPLDNLFVLILSSRRILISDTQSVEFESNFEAKLLPRLKMKISIVRCRLCNYDVAQKQHGSHFVQLLI